MHFVGISEAVIRRRRGILSAHTAGAKLPCAQRSGCFRRVPAMRTNGSRPFTSVPRGVMFVVLIYLTVFWKPSAALEGTPNDQTKVEIPFGVEELTARDGASGVNGHVQKELNDTANVTLPDVDDADDSEAHAGESVKNLLQLLGEAQATELHHKDLVSILRRGYSSPPKLASRTPGRQPPNEQVKKKMFHIVDGFMDTVGVTILGQRPEDEDAMLLTAPIEGHPKSLVKALFDGHAGYTVSRKCAMRLPQFLGNVPDFSGDTFVKVSLALDSSLKHDPEVSSAPGSTGIMAVFDPPDPSVPEFDLYVANVGDSRLLVLHSDGSFTPMSHDHKPNDALEMARVRRAGGDITRADAGPWRVDGRLALSRAFGDFRMKLRNDLLATRQRVVSIPDTRRIKVRAGDVVLLACDGVFEAPGMNWNCVAHLIAHHLKATNGNLEEAAMRLVTTAYLLGSHDNISAMLVKIRADSAENVQVTGAEVDVLGIRHELSNLFTDSPTMERSGAWTTDLGLFATLY